MIKPKYKFIATSFAGSVWSLSAAAQESTPPPAPRDSWIFWTAGTVLLAIFFFVAVVMYSATSVARAEKTGTISLRQWLSGLNRRFFTRAVPVAKEADILLDHDYDGIKELDNALPPWWKYGFYITIFIAALYLLRFHVWKTGPTPQQEYESEMKIAAQKIEAYRLQAGETVDEKTVTMADATGIAEGDKLFHANCFACHGAAGEGGVGPNLTDNYWLHGGTINDIFKTIKYGYPDKGMQSWEKTYSPSQIRNLASYVKSLVGTNPPNAKAPQGDLFEDAATGQTRTDTSAAQ